MKLQVKNFQAIKEATIEGTGLIVITGPSNRGKSSMLRAVELAVFGGTGDAFVRRGENAALVGLKDDNLLLKWRKVVSGKASPTLMSALELNGQSYTKLGREHSDLTAGLGFKEIRTKDGKTRLRPQFAAQHDSMFLITETDITVAEVMRELGRADVITDAQKAVKSDKRQMELRKSVREEDNLRVVKEVQDLAWVSGFQVGVKRVSQECLLIEQKSKLLDLVMLKSARWRSLAPKQIPVDLELPDLNLQVRKLDLVRKLRSLAPKQIPVDVELPTTIEFLGRDLARVRALKDLRQVIWGTQLKLDGVSREIEDAEREEKQLRVELGVCPLCGQVLGESKC